jgi:DNA-directed RNA polymerase specialized sigma24 family protein
LRDIDRVFQQHYDHLVAWCRKRLRRNMDAPEDVVHQAYVRCVHSWKPGRGCPHRPHYVYRALRWALLDMLRAYRRRAQRREAADVAGCAAPFWSPDGWLAAQESLARLPRRQRALCDAVMNGQDCAQIERRLGLSANAQAVYLCRARAALEAVWEAN